MGGHVDVDGVLSVGKKLPFKALHDYWGEGRQSTVICAVVENVSRFSIDIAENSTWAKLQFLVMLMFSKC